MEESGGGREGRTYVRVERGPMIGGSGTSFSDYGAAKAYFDYLEELYSGDHMQGTESVHQVYVLSALRKPRPATPKNDKSYRGTLIHRTPFSDTLARRKEAGTDHLLGLENKRATAQFEAAVKLVNEEHARNREQRERLEQAERGC